MRWWIKIKVEELSFENKQGFEFTFNAPKKQNFKFKYCYEMVSKINRFSPDRRGRVYHPDGGISRPITMSTLSRGRRFSTGGDIVDQNFDPLSWLFR